MPDEPNLYLMYRDRVPQGFLRASSARLNAPARLLGTPHKRNLWRAGAPGVARVILDIGYQSSVGAVCLLEHNLGSGNATWRVRTSIVDPDAITSTTHDSGDVAIAAESVFKQVWYTMAPQVQARYVGLDLYDPSPTLVPQAGRMLAGPYYRTSFGYEPRVGGRDPSRIEELDDGSESRDLREVRRNLTVPVNYETPEKARSDALDMALLIGTSRDVAVITPTLTLRHGRDLIVGRATSFVDISVPTHRVWSYQLTVEERR